jgi:hypothetical protein
MNSSTANQMTSAKHQPRTASRTTLPRWTLAVAGLGVTTLPAMGWQLASNLTVRAEMSVKEGYDSNVYLQNQEPNLTLVPKAAQPHTDSFITTLTPGVFFDYQPCAAFNFSGSYTPAIAFYYSTPSENHVANRITGNLSGKIQETPWELLNALNIITGQNEGVYYGGTPYVGGNVPALGGIPVRDRRDATVYRGGFRTTLTKEKFFVRPVASVYVHNFHTVQKTNSLLLANATPNPNFGYENYVDRNEFAGGLDVGYEVAEDLRLYALYRYGHEGEGNMVGSPFSYGNSYNRPGGGLEGQPWPWLKLAMAFGADIHQTTCQRTAPGFERDYTKLWSDTLITFLPTPQDTITFKFTKNTQPAFSSPSVYDDTVFDVLGRHKFGPHWSVGAGMRWYNGDWFKPVLRNDWVYTASASVAYTYNAHLSAELTYSYDWTDCDYPPLDTAGREYTRSLVWLGMKYAF